MRIKPPFGKLTSYILKSASSDADTVCCHTKWLFSQQKLMWNLMRLPVFCYLNWMNMSECTTISRLPPPGDSTSIAAPSKNYTTLLSITPFFFFFFFKCHMNPETFFKICLTMWRGILFIYLFFVNNNQYTFEEKTKKHLYRWAFLKWTVVEM